MKIPTGRQALRVRKLSERRANRPPDNKGFEIKVKGVEARTGSVTRSDASKAKPLSIRRSHPMQIKTKSPCQVTYNVLKEHFIQFKNAEEQEGPGPTDHGEARPRRLQGSAEASTESNLKPIKIP